MTHSVQTTNASEGRDLIATTGEGQVITTDFKQGTAVTVVLPPAQFSEVLEYTNDFYLDGRIQREGDEDGRTERVRIAAGESRRIGDWLWGAGPLALIGVRVND